MEGQAGAVGASDAAGGRLLDLGTQLPTAGHWLAKGWPQAGEASIAYVATGNGSDEKSAWSKLEDDERRARNHKRASQRAKGETRRYLVSNRLRYMWVLTFPGEGLHDADGRAECMRQVAAFAERLTAAFGRQPYWYSPEIHPGGHGWHVNFFVRHRLNHERVAALWDHGFVWVKDWTQDTRIKSLGLPVVAAIRLGATYGCKYASKDWSEEALSGGAHRYEVAQGFQPDEHAERHATLAEAMATVFAWFGGLPPCSTWSSGDVEDWDGPPAYCFTWADGLDERVPGG